MSDINTVIITGRITRDPEVKTFDNGGSVINLSVACNDSVKKGEEWVDVANFFDVSYSVKNPSKIVAMLPKGTAVTIEGRLKQSTWEKDGQKRSMIRINASSVKPHFVQKSQPNGTASQRPQQQQQPQQSYGNNAGYSNGGFPEDIPF